MATTTQFQSIGAVKVGRSAFDLSYEKIFNCHFGQLIPVMHDSCIPGDYWKIGNELVIRTTPLVAPVLHEINATIHYFFVSYNSLDSNFGGFVSGGEDGADSSSLPRWDNHTDTAKYSLWDYFGFPVGVTVPASDNDAPIDYPKRAYNKIWNYWYRDSILQSEITETTAKDIQYRNWEKDYFTASANALQLGTAPALDITGTASADWPAVNSGSPDAMTCHNTLYVPDDAWTKSTLENNTIDLSVADGILISDLRLQVQIQKWMERNMRAGGRYSEYIESHFAIPSQAIDSRLQNPEYIGGTKANIIISEIPNTSDTATADQGELAGNGLLVDSGYAGEYHVKEFGVIIGLLSIMPRTMYSQGIDRQWLQTTKYDFYAPEWANLSEQVITKGELYYNGDGNDDDTFGYIGRYDHHRAKKNLVCADMRDTFDYWHLGRQFASAPTLNSTFIECKQANDDLDRIFASTSEPPFIVHINNKITAVRPIPVMAEPGIETL